jgi:hypothetical protein
MESHPEYSNTIAFKNIWTWKSGLKTSIIRAIDNEIVTNPSDVICIIAEKRCANRPSVIIQFAHPRLSSTNPTILPTECDSTPSPLNRNRRNYME